MCDRCLWALDAFERYRGLAPESGDHCANCLLGVGELLDAVDRPAVCEQAVATAMGGLHLERPNDEFFHSGRAFWRMLTPSVSCQVRIWAR